MGERRHGLGGMLHGIISRVRGYDSDNAALFSGRPGVLKRNGLTIPVTIYGNGGYNDEVVAGVVELSESLTNPLATRNVDASKNHLSAVGQPAYGFQKVEADLEGNKVTLYQAVP
jgi:hypothetical protein